MRHSLPLFVALLSAAIPFGCDQKQPATSGQAGKGAQQPLAGDSKPSEKPPQPNVPKTKKSDGKNDGKSPAVEQLVAAVTNTADMVAASESGDGGKAFLVLVDRNVRVAEAIKVVRAAAQEKEAVAKMKGMIDLLSTSGAIRDKMTVMNCTHALKELGSKSAPR